MAIGDVEEVDTLSVREGEGKPLSEENKLVFKYEGPYRENV